MTKEEASTLLGLPDNASEAEIKKKYGELYNDFQIRLTNAPTPNLKKLYQKNLQELNEGLSVLLGTAAQGVMQDLPSSTPTYGAGASTAGPQATHQTTTSTTSRARKGKADSAASTKLTEENKKLKKQFNLTLIASIILGACLALSVVLLLQANGQKAELSGTNATLEQEKAQVTKQLESLKTTHAPFENGKFKIRNTGDSELIVTWLIVTYRNNNGKLIKHEDYVNSGIRPGASEELSKYNGATEIWDGSVVSYACGLEYRGSTLIQSGLWSQDSKDGLLILNLDNY